MPTRRLLLQGLLGGGAGLLWAPAPTLARTPEARTAQLDAQLVEGRSTPASSR